MFIVVIAVILSVTLIALYVSAAIINKKNNTKIENEEVVSENKNITTADVWYSELGNDVKWVYAKQYFQHVNGYVLLWQEKINGAYVEYVRVRNTETGDTQTWECLPGAGYIRVFEAARKLRQDRSPLPEEQKLHNFTVQNLAEGFSEGITYSLPIEEIPAVLRRTLQHGHVMVSYEGKLSFISNTISEQFFDYKIDQIFGEPVKATPIESFEF